jgi:pimeloyl-ACP methyl ester carboxylesterase
VQLPLTGFDDDVDVVREAILTAGPGVVVCAHSYGGVVLSPASAKLTAINRLVFLTAIMANTGEDVNALTGAQPSLLHDSLLLTGDAVSVDLTKIHAVFYADSSAADVDTIRHRLRPMSISAGIPVVTEEPGWKHIPTTYVVCANDQAINPVLQRMMAKRADTVIEWPTDHSPFLTRPEAIAALLSSYL